ncbi:MAG: BRO family protein [Methylocella sp.]
MANVVQLSVAPLDFEGNTIRSVYIDGKKWFVLPDICKVLEIKNSSMVSRRLDADEKGITTIDTRGGPQKISIINESGCYALTLRSYKTVAKRFRKWLTSEVIPSIRETGSYGLPAPALAIDYLNPALQLGFVQALQAQAAALTQAVVERDVTIAVLEPKAKILEKIIESEQDYGIYEAAKVIGLPCKRFKEWLIKKDWIFKRGPQDKIHASARGIAAGVMRMRKRKSPAFGPLFGAGPLSLILSSSMNVIISTAR